eukprot:4950035-Pleurochrysis_carterae.AAC.1
MSTSSATGVYETVAHEATPRATVQMERLPISSKKQLSPSDAKAAEMKSAERLLRMAWTRWPTSCVAVPYAHAVASRELHAQRTPAPRSTVCFCGRPAEPNDAAPSHCAYSSALSPTPPAAACTRMRCAHRSAALRSEMCTVLHVTGSVDASSKESACGLGATSSARAYARHASGDSPMPKTLSPTHSRDAAPSSTSPPKSAPGGPGSPGYSPSTLSTSRKLSPMARTRTTTLPSGGGGSAGCGSRRRLSSAPRP